MNYLFPIKQFYRISKEHVVLTWIVFVLFIFFSNFIGSSPTYARNFFYPSEHYLWDVYFRYMDIVHTKASGFIFALFFNILEFWMIYLLSGVKKSIEFTKFILPFICYAYIGIVLRLFDLFPGIQIFNPPIGVLVTIYFFVFFIYVLIMIYSLKPLKSIVVVFVAFISERILSVLLFGPTIGMILQELKI